MRKQLIILILLILYGAIGHWSVSPSQERDERKPCTASMGVPLSSKSPTVYISYDHAGNREASAARLLENGPTAAAKEDRVEAVRTAKFLWLRIYNNTPWTIAIPTESLYVGTAISPWHLCDGVGVLGLRDGLEVNAYYHVDTVGPERSLPPAVPNRIDVIPTSWLPPGRSVIFQVRHEYVSERYSIYLSFNYEWETRKGVVRSGEPEHRTYFYAWMLPAEFR
jgi:hypothetical protein